MALTIVYGTAFAVPASDSIVNSDRVRLYVMGDRTYVGEQTTDIAHVCSEGCQGRIIATAQSTEWSTAHPAWKKCLRESWYTHLASFVSLRKLTLGDIERVSTADVTDFDPGDDPYVTCSACGNVLLDREDEIDARGYVLPNDGIEVD